MISLRKLSPQTPLWQPDTLLATWFGSGLIKPASGTWGSLASLPFILVICLYCGSAISLYAFIALTFVIGTWVSHRYMQKTKKHDASEIVIDETCGLSICFIPFFMLNISDIQHITLYTAFAFVGFRFFDALKPWPISWCDKKILGALGVMIDDVLAGIVTAILIYKGWALWMT